MALRQSSTVRLNRPSVYREPPPAAPDPKALWESFWTDVLGEETASDTKPTTKTRRWIKIPAQRAPEEETP